MFILVSVAFFIIRNVRDFLLCIFVQLKISSNYFRKKDYLCREVFFLNLENETVKFD